MLTIILKEIFNDKHFMDVYAYKEHFTFFTIYALLKFANMV